MILRYVDDGTLGDYEVVWVSSGRRPAATIRARCEPVACDIATKRLLYDVDDAVARLSELQRRAPHRRRRVAA